MNKIILKTERLYAREFKESDLDNLYKLHSHPMVAEFTIDAIQSKEEVRKHLHNFIIHQNNYGFSQWAIFEDKTDNFIGRAGYVKRKLSDDVQEEVEIRFAIMPNFWNRGYASEITNNLIKYASQELRLIKIVAGNNPANEKSIKILSKFGFKFIKKVTPKGYGAKDEIDYRELILASK